MPTGPMAMGPQGGSAPRGPMGSGSLGMGAMNNSLMPGGMGVSGIISCLYRFTAQTRPYVVIGLFLFVESLLGLFTL